MLKNVTNREKILVVILLVISIGLAYYKLFYEPVQNDISKLQIAASDDESKAMALMAKVTQVEKMQAFIAEAEASGEADAIPYFNNSKNVLVSLRGILDAANSYTLSFEKTSQSSYIISRPVQAEFETNTYAEARSIIDRLTNESYINQISDVTINTNDVTVVSEETGETVETHYTTSLTITFFEIDPQV